MCVVAILGYLIVLLFFFFNDTATTEIYTLSLHDALPIWRDQVALFGELLLARGIFRALRRRGVRGAAVARSEEHTSELQSHSDLVCRLLLEKKKIIQHPPRQRTNCDRLHRSHPREPQHER